MTIFLACVWIGGMLIFAGGAETLAKAIRALTDTLKVQAWATHQSAKAIDENIVIVKAQMDMMRQLIEAGRRRHAPPPDGSVTH